MSEFSRRVLEVARKLETTPFRGKVSIAQIYDAYGVPYDDAGSLKSFKERLIISAKNRELDLARLDMPERMNRELAHRSKTPWGNDEVHFVVTNWV